MTKGAAADKEDCHSPLSSSSSATDLTLESSYDIISRVSDDDLSVISDGYDEEHYVLSESTSSLDLGGDDGYSEEERKERQAPSTPPNNSGYGYGILETPDLSMVSLSGSNNTLRMPQMMDSSSSSFCVGDASELEKTRSMIYRGIDYNQCVQRVIPLASSNETSSKHQLGFLPWINLIGFGRNRESVQELMSHYMNEKSRYKCYYCYFADAKTCEITIESVATGQVHHLEDLDLDGCTVALVQLSGGSFEQGFCLADVYSVLKQHDIPAVTVADTPIYLRQFATHRFLFSPNAPISVSHEPGNPKSVLFSPLVPSQFGYLQFEDFERILLDGGHPVPAPQLIQRTDWSSLSFRRFLWFRYNTSSSSILTACALLCVYLVLLVITPYIIVRSNPDSSFARLFNTNISVTNISINSSSTTSTSRTVTSMANSNIISASGVNSKLKALATPGEKSVVVLKVEQTKDGPQVVAYKDPSQTGMSTQQLNDLGITKTFLSFQDLVRLVPVDFMRQSAVRIWEELMSLSELLLFTIGNTFKEIELAIGYSMKLTRPHVNELRDKFFNEYSNLCQFTQTIKDVQVPEARKRAKEYAENISQTMNEHSLWVRQRLSQLSDQGAHQMLKWKQDAGQFVSQMYNHHFKEEDEPPINRARKRSRHLVSKAKSMFDAKQTQAKNDLSTIYSRFSKRHHHKHNKHQRSHRKSNCRARFWPL